MNKISEKNLHKISGLFNTLVFLPGVLFYQSKIHFMIILNGFLYHCVYSSNYCMRIYDTIVNCIFISYYVYNMKFKSYLFLLLLFISGVNFLTNKDTKCEICHLRHVLGVQLMCSIASYIALIFHNCC